MSQADLLAEAAPFRVGVALHALEFRTGAGIWPGRPAITAGANKKGMGRGSPRPKPDLAELGFHGIRQLPAPRSMDSQTIPSYI